MLKNIPVYDKKEEKRRKIMIIVMLLICVLSIVVTMYLQIKEMSTTQEEEEVKEIVEVKEFNSIFDNSLKAQGYDLEQIKRKDLNKEVIYVEYELNEKEPNKHDMNVSIPVINIESPEVEKINKEIEQIFKAKAESIIENETEYEVIYTVEYTAYMNSNILSLVIKSTLKEGINAQRVIVQAYTYDTVTNKLINIDEILSIKQLQKEPVERQIREVVSENAKQNESLISLGYKVYERNLEDQMYEIENVSNFFYGPNGVLYIIYAYGNNSYTSELDVIPVK